MDTSKVLGTAIAEAVCMTKETCSVEIKFANAIYGIKDTLETIRNSMRLCPQISQNRVMKERNKGGLWFSYLANLETVNFKYGDNKGTFTHGNNI